MKIIREKLIKGMAFEIGLCGSVRPEKQAAAAIDWMLKWYDITPKNQPGGE